MYGPSQCEYDWECKGNRTCSGDRIVHKSCQGDSGCSDKLLVLEASCNYDEAQNPLGPNRCTSDAECAGARTCSDFAWCEGDSECDAKTQDACNYDESKNPLGPNRCTENNECAGART